MFPQLKSQNTHVNTTHLSKHMLTHIAKNHSTVKSPEEAVHNMRISNGTRKLFQEEQKEM